ncbi:EAL domain-containing protein [Ramlibacter sp. 2FC]|uniref:EAL domain-containing protein n=1 Tax=Ramlibacter sp. 2FC TaxID=2502188 RepID=UPI00201DB31B|nr:EAL domain-containing protein [Ramlibacter sp. 2FC]
MDRVLRALSIYALPVAIALLSLIALLFWQPQHPQPEARALDFRVLEDGNAALTPAQALAQLPAQPLVARHDTRLSEAPRWLLFSAERRPDEPAQAIEFTSRHTVALACWDAASLRPLGEADRRATTGPLSQVKAGFALSLNPAAAEQGILCKVRSVGPARLTLLQWPTARLHLAAEDFHRNSGLLDGGLIVLALFVFITALINRNGTYVLFAAWLVLNLRMGALSAGWDTQWLGRLAPHEWLIQGRLVTIALFYIATVTLFKAMFQEDLVKVGYKYLLKALQWTCPPLLVLSMVLPYKLFLPLVWTAAAFGISILVFYLVRILQLSRSPVAIWYGLSIATTLFASLYEVISAALGLQNFIGAINSVTAALSSSLLASLAIAAQMRQEHDQKLEAQAELQHTYEAIPIGLFALDLNGQFTNANPALTAMLGTEVLAPGRNAWQQHFSEADWLRLHWLVNSQKEAELEIEGRPEEAGAAPRRFLVRATLARERIEGSLQDVTEKSRATAHLEFLAQHDPLTKALNRRGTEAALAQALQQLEQQETPLTLAYLDLDRFKLINDLYGHLVGDEVLQQVCARINTVISGEMRLGRVGGDEFVIVLPGTKIALAALICRGIVDAIGSTPYQVGEQAFHVVGSMGLIEVGAGTSSKDAVSTADRACREAKAGHSDNLVVYEKNSKVFREHEDELRLVAHLATPDATAGFYLEMQPIMSLKAPYQSLNFEVLLRMRDPQGQFVPTARVIAAAENSGRMGMIDRWVLTTTLNWIQAHLPRLAQTRFVCMNLSGSSLNDEKFIQDVFAQLEQHRDIAPRLCLEITESVALHDIEKTRQFIDQVRAYGAKVALDDFGAGYTSFSYLKDLPSDLLKIDGSLIVNINHHPANVSIVEAIVSLGRNLGMKTVAEWAEDHAAVQTLAEIGVDYVQGYAIARPLAAERLLRASSSASFIEDQALIQLIRALSQSEHPLPKEPGFLASEHPHLH